MSDAVGQLVRDWRLRRRMSQEALSHECGVSTRHLSCIETGKAHPSRTMLARLGGALQVPLRVHRELLMSAGYLPGVSETPLAAPAMAQVNAAIEAVLAGHEPFPALVIDGGWDLVAANEAAYRLLGDLPDDLLAPPVNVIRLSVDPRGLGDRIVNLPQWRQAITARLRHEYEVSGDPRLAALLQEVSQDGVHAADGERIVLPLQIQRADEVLSFFTLTTVFASPWDVTVAELAIEALYPADAATRSALLADLP